MDCRWQHPAVLRRPHVHSHRGLPHRPEHPARRHDPCAETPPGLFCREPEGDPLDNKYFYTTHSELNAILNFRGNKRDFENSKIYVALFPCNECAKAIIQSGIKEVIYLSDKYHNEDNAIASRRLFDACGVKYHEIKVDKTIEIELDK